MQIIISTCLQDLAEVDKMCLFSFLFLVLVNSGSRHEAKYPSGIAHFIEKLAFSVSKTKLKTTKLKVKEVEVCKVMSFFLIFSPQLSTGVKMKFSSRWKNTEGYVTAKHQGM